MAIEFLRQNQSNEDYDFDFDIKLLTNVDELVAGIKETIKFQNMAYLKDSEGRIVAIGPEWLMYKMRNALGDYATDYNISSWEDVE